jgi:hypothetical protein
MTVLISSSVSLETVIQLRVAVTEARDSSGTKKEGEHLPLEAATKQGCEDRD